jgi:hypothetical protein
MSDEGPVSLIGRAGWWLVAGVAVSFAVIALRYLAMYRLPDGYFYAQNLPLYRALPHAIYFLAHVAAMALLVFAAVRLILAPYPFEPKKGWTHVYLASCAVGGFYGFYYPWVHGPFDVSSYIMVTIASILGYTGIQAWRRMRDPDAWEHRKWMVYNFMLVFGAAIWRMVYYALSDAGFEANPDPATHARLYHSAWFLSFVGPLLLAAAIVSRMKRRPVEATLESPSLAGLRP